MSDAIEKALDAVDWRTVEAAAPADGIPTVTHEGVLNFGGIAIRVVQLSDGRRVIPSEEFEKLFGNFNHRQP